MLVPMETFDIGQPVCVDLDQALRLPAGATVPDDLLLEFLAAGAASTGHPRWRAAIVSRARMDGRYEVSVTADGAAPATLLVAAMGVRTRTPDGGCEA